MKDITNDFQRFFYPVSALVFYQSKRRYGDTYVEFFDMDKNGLPVNAHPLTVNEAERLAKALRTKEEKEHTLLKPNGILKSNILYFDQRTEKAIWFSKAQRRRLFFTNAIGIPSGIAHVPAMLWIADRTSLSVFALGNDRRPTASTQIYNAPFFNVYENGNVCMGTVDVNIAKTVSLEEFTVTWEDYFFNSYFSHLMQGHNPVKGNGVLLWESLVGTDKKFPLEVLTKSKRTIKELMQ